VLVYEAAESVSSQWPKGRCGARGSVAWHRAGGPGFRRLWLDRIVRSAPAGSVHGEQQV